MTCAATVVTVPAPVAPTDGATPTAVTEAAVVVTAAVVVSIGGAAVAVLWAATGCAA